MGHRIVRTLASAALAAGLCAGMGIGTATPALADDPRDPTMTPEAIARDREIIRRMNLDQLAKVRKRDAGYAEGWRAYDEANGRRREALDDDAGEYGRRAYRDRDSGRRDAGSSSSYADAQDEYRAELARWRRDVQACRDGYTDYCARR